MQADVNLKIKFREGFRPFAPSVLRERAGEWFELDAAGGDAPYMLLVVPVRPERRLPVDDARRRGLWGIDLLNEPRSDIPAVTHVDYSGRVQTVSADTSPEYHALLAAFEALTGCPVLVNTSFNVRGEPIVCTPEDAYRCFMRTHLDHLVLGRCLLAKEAQPRGEGAPAPWGAEFPPD
jgi:carbamoyltransferase